MRYPWREVCKSPAKDIAMARGKHKFTQMTLERLVQAFKMGMTDKHACAFSGISVHTLNEWRAGVIPKGVSQKFSEHFLSELEKAEADMVARVLLGINKAAQGDIQNGIAPDWKAGAWMLERRHPEQFGRILTRMEHVNAKDEPFQISVSAPKVEQMLGKLDQTGLDALEQLMGQLGQAAGAAQEMKQLREKNDAIEAEYVEVS